MRQARSKGISRLIAAALGAGLLGAHPAASAEKAFTGEDAAYIDWAFKTCEMVSTPKEHALADAAAQKAEAYTRGYSQQMQKLIDAPPPASELLAKEKCDEVKSWYGPVGTRIAGLINDKNKPAAAGTSVGSKATGASSGGSGKRSGGRRGGS